MSSDAAGIERMIDAFRLFDPSHTGKVPAESMRHILTTFGKPFNKEEMDEFLADGAGGSDEGYIVYEPFVRNVVFGS